VYSVTTIPIFLSYVLYAGCTSFITKHIIAVAVSIA